MKAIVIAILVLAVALGLILSGHNLQTETSAVLVGVVCGIAAGIPTCWLLLVILTRRHWAKQEQEQRQVTYIIQQRVVDRWPSLDTLPALGDGEVDR